MTNDNKINEQEIFDAIEGKTPRPPKYPPLVEYLEVIIQDLESLNRELSLKKYNKRKRLFPWLFCKYEYPNPKLRKIEMALSTAKNALAVAQKKKAQPPSSNPFGITFDRFDP